MSAALALSIWQDSHIIIEHFLNWFFAYDWWLVERYPIGLLVVFNQNILGIVSAWSEQYYIMWGENKNREKQNPFGNKLKNNQTTWKTIPVFISNHWLAWLYCSAYRRTKKTTNTMRFGSSSTWTCCGSSWMPATIKNNTSYWVFSGFEFCNFQFDLGWVQSPLVYGLTSNQSKFFTPWYFLHYVSDPCNRWPCIWSEISLNIAFNLE